MRAIKVGREKPVEAPLSERSIEKYTYASLSDTSTEIRLLNIHPGAKDDPIIVQIDHVRLTDSGSPTKHGLSHKSMDDINRSLPTGWVALDTWSQRVLYFNPALEFSIWQHPGVKDCVNSQESPVRPAPDGSAKAPHYEALSYTWGSTKDREAIYVRNSDGEHWELLVTKNLALALRHLRCTMAKRTMWIDAICINQEDMQERNMQVQRMTSIYRLAHRVVVWLGLDSHLSSLAMSTLDYLGEQVEISRGGNVFPAPRAAEQHWYKDNVVLPYDSRSWDAVMRLCQRPYFTRVWIMQELHLSNHRTVLQCGSDSMSWMNLRKAVKCLHMSQNLPSPLFRNETSVVRQLGNYDARKPYRQLNMAVRDRHCSDDRDRIYGLLGLMPECLRDRITPNYEMTVGEVYRQETVAQIEFFQRLDVLSECGPHRAIDGPSWVPNPALGHSEISWVRCASGISRCYVAFKSPNVVEISGLQVGTVRSVQEKEHWEFGEGIQHTKAWAYRNLDRDVYALTLCGMYVRERWLESSGMIQYCSPLPSLEEWKRFYYGGTEDTDGPGEEVTPFFLRYVEQCIWSRTLFVMDDEQIGLGPETMETGKLSRHGNP